MGVNGGTIGGAMVKRMIEHAEREMAEKRHRAVQADEAAIEEANRQRAAKAFAYDEDENIP